MSFFRRHRWQGTARTKQRTWTQTREGTIIPLRVLQPEEQILAALSPLYVVLVPTLVILGW